MTSEPPSPNDPQPEASALRRMTARAVALAQWGFVVGGFVGVAEAAASLESIGPIVDRVGTMGVTVAVDAVAGAGIAAVLGAITGLAMPPASTGMALRRGPALLLAATAVIGTAFAAIGASDRGTNPSNHPHILLISIDTLRADHLSAYGYGRETSPRLDALARQGVLFVDATSHSTWTLPAHVSMLTGLDPAAHGVLAREHRIQDYHHTLAERLREAGYATAAWVGTRDWGFVGSRYGFDEGFDRFEHFPHPKRFRSARLLREFDEWWLWHGEGGVGNARAEVTNVINWIAAEREQPFFAFVHFYDVHSKGARLPYEAPAPYRDMFCEGNVDEVEACDEGVCATERLLEIARGWKKPLDAEEIEWARCLYDGGIAFVDHEVGRLLDVLEDRELLDDMVVIVTSDHGEAFFEHRKPLHSTLHQEITRIPLIIRSPDAIAGKRANGVVRQSDLLPTVLELAGVEVVGEIQGRSLVPLLEDWHASSDAEVLAFDDSGGSVLLRSGTKTLIQRQTVRKLEGRPEREYYDLALDPKQEHNRQGREKKAVAELTLKMGERMRESDALRKRLRGGEASVDVEIDKEVEAGLRALGYVVDENEEPSEAR